MSHAARRIDGDPNAVVRQVWQVVFRRAALREDASTDYSSLSCKLAGDDCLFKCDTEAPSTKNYGAISYSRESEFSGTSHGFSNRASAEARAQTECAIGGRDCKVIVWFWNSCAAIAVGGDVVAWGRDPSLRVAKASALNECRNSDGAGCRIEDLACSP